jgi:Ran GTPase-activating protein (RanGAP) involved in mRNA processing and transport
MKDDFKAVVPSPSRRVTPQPQQQQQSGARRPSDTNNNANASRGAAASGPSAHPSPRAKAHTVKDNPSSIGTASGYHAESTKEQLGSPARHNATFITALAAVKPLSQRRLVLGENAARTSVLRPPSPLEAADADRAREVSLSSSSGGSPGAEPLAANYVGAGALDTFWRLFHREETVNNHAIAAAPVPRPSSPVLPTTARSSKPNGTLRRPSLLVPLSDRPRSARSTYLAAVRKLHLTPEPLGIVRRRVHDKGPSSSASSIVSSALACTTGTGSPQEINLSSFCLGDAYTTALSESVALVPSVEAINLSHNRMSDTVAARLVANIVYAPNALHSLNLSHNTLGPNAARAIAELLQTSRSLTTLNLSHNALKDRDVSVLCDALQKNQTLQRIHLSENRFGVPGMVAIAKFLEENAKIEEVYLAWNNLRGLGALKIVEALKFHASIRVLDLSWNALDANDLLKSPRAIVTVLADALANNKVLTHLDLSNNRLDRHDCELLAAQLEQNHVLMGLHMSGNCGAMDSRGFLIPKDSPVKLQDQHKMYSIAVFEECMSESGTGVFPSHAAPLVDRFCWFCGQWSEHRFAWTPPAEALPPGAPLPVKVHLCHDDWRGVEMEKRDDGSYSAYVVLPPGKTEYFFTVTDRATDHVSHHYMKEKRHVRRDHLDRASEALGAITYVNVLRLARRDGRDPCNTLTPRSTGKGTGERVAKWDINRSVFARRRRESAQRSFVDTDAFVAKACSADWRQCKVDRFVKDAARRKEVEVSVARHYRTIANVYRHFCGHNVLTSVAFLAAMTPAMALQIQNDITSVPWSGYVEFLTECKILDESSEFCRYADCENVFVAANLELTQEAKEKDNPDRSLTRFEFMEAVIRIAINKFHRSEWLL